MPELQKVQVQVLLLHECKNTKHKQNANYLEQQPSEPINAAKLA